MDEDEGDNNADNSKRKYFRILQGLDVTSEQNKSESILKEVFNNLAMKVGLANFDFSIGTQT